MQPNPDPKNMIEELKEAGEELNRAPLAEFSQSKKPPNDKAHPRLKEEKADLLKIISEYQAEIAQEQSALEKSHREVKELEKKIETRIELLKKLQTKSKEFQAELKLAQEENTGFLEQIKNKLESNLSSS